MSSSWRRRAHQACLLGLAVTSAFHATPPPARAPSWQRQAAHGRLCRKCQPHLSERPLLTLTRPPAGRVGREQPRVWLCSLWAQPFLVSLSQLWLQPQEVTLKVAWGWGAISSGSGLKWRWRVGSWVGLALNLAKGRCPVAMGSGLGYGINWVGMLTLTSPLTSCAT